MISILLAIWIPSSLVGALLSTLMFLQARRVHRYLKAHPGDADHVELHLARSMRRREGTKAVVLILLLATGLIVAGSILEVVDDPLVRIWPILLTFASVLLSMSSILNYIDDRNLQLEVIKDRLEDDDE